MRVRILVVHAGEAAGPESLAGDVNWVRSGWTWRKAIEAGADDFLAEQQIGIESCLTSHSDQHRSRAGF